MMSQIYSSKNCFYMSRILIKKQNKYPAVRRRSAINEHEEDLHEGLSRKLEEYDGETSYDDKDDWYDDYEEIDGQPAEIDDIYSSEDTYSDEDEEELLHNKELTVNLVDILRNEIKKLEPDRDYLLYKYRGEVCEGIPMAEINPNKFIFKVDGKMKSVTLSEIKIL